jgi:hypothetical protein
MHVTEDAMLTRGYRFKEISIMDCFNLLLQEATAFPGDSRNINPERRAGI